MIKFVKRVLLSIFILAPLAGAATILWWSVNCPAAVPPAQKPVEQPQPVEKPQPLHIIEAPALDVTPRLVVYGVAEPDRTSQTTARVQGSIVYFNPDLRPGNVVAKDTVLLRIDPKAYELNLAKADAHILGGHAELEQIEQKVKNDKLSLEIEKASLDIAVRDLKRSRGLLEKGAASQAAVDADERAVLAQERIVQLLENSLNLAASIRQAKEAQLAAGHISLEQAQHDLDCTVIKADATAVLSDVFVHEGQFVTENQPLFESYRGDTMTVQCTAPHERVEGQFQERTVERLNREIRTYRHSQNLEDIFDITVNFDNGPETFTWQGQLKALTEAVDNGTRTVELTVTVQNPEKAGTTDKPTLLKGTCCTVEFATSRIENQVFLPQTAIHNDYVYVLNESSGLERRYIKTAFHLDNLVAIKEGVQVGDKIVVSKLAPAQETGLVYERDLKYGDFADMISRDGVAR